MYDHDHENEVTYFARTNYRNQLVKFGMKTDDRRRHVYIIGKTGMGKTTLMENIMLSDVYAGHGCCYVDPHGDTAEKLLDYIPEHRIQDVVYFNPADIEHPIGFNIFEAVDERHKHLVASGMMGIFKKIWENMWSSRMEYILNNTILALLDNPGSTLLGINRILSDSEYRQEMISNVKDPIVKQFWVKEFASYNDKYAQEAVAPIQNKIGQFLSASVIRNIVAQVKSTFDVRQIMDENKIFIVNLSKGRIGEDNSRLLGGLLITKLQLAAMERVDIPEEKRRDFYLFVDEFQNFAVESFASILSEARKYRLCLLVAHQYIAQLSDEVREAVFGNVGTIMSFRVGSPDATFMETEFAPRFVIEDIINLPKYNMYLKLLIDGVASQPFSAISLAPIAQKTGSADRVIAASRERFTVTRANIEQKVIAWSGMAEDMDIIAAMKETKQKSKDAKKPKFDYDCKKCTSKFSLPVELDRTRAIFCKNCIEDIKEEKAKVEGKPYVRTTTVPAIPNMNPVIKEPADSHAKLESLSEEPKTPPEGFPTPKDLTQKTADLKQSTTTSSGTSSVNKPTEAPKVIIQKTEEKPAPVKTEAPKTERREPRVDSDRSNRTSQRPNTRPDRRPERRPESRPDRQPDSRPDRRPDRRSEPRPDRNTTPQASRGPQSRSAPHQDSRPPRSDSRPVRREERQDQKPTSKREQAIKKDNTSPQNTNKQSFETDTPNTSPKPSAPRIEAPRAEKPTPAPAPVKTHKSMVPGERVLFDDFDD